MKKKFKAILHINGLSFVSALNDTAQNIRKEMELTEDYHASNIIRVLDYLTNSSNSTLPAEKIKFSYQGEDEKTGHHIVLLEIDGIADYSFHFYYDGVVYRVSAFSVEQIVQALFKILDMFNVTGKTREAFIADLVKEPLFLDNGVSRVVTLQVTDENEYGGEYITEVPITFKVIGDAGNILDSLGDLVEQAFGKYLAEGRMSYE